MLGFDVRVAVQDTLYHASNHCFLLAEPSDSMPSHPTALPATSSTFPKPDACGSRFALAAFIALIPACLSCSADDCQLSPITLPTTLCKQ